MADSRTSSRTSLTSEPSRHVCLLPNGVVLREYKAEFDKNNIWYEHRLIDDLVHSYIQVGD